MNTYKYLVDFDGHKAEDTEAMDPALFNIDALVGDGIIALASDDAAAEAAAALAESEAAAAKAQADKDEAEAQAAADAAAAEDQAKADAEAEAAAAQAAAAKVPVRMYRGQQVISTGHRELNDKTYHTVRLADGSTEDLTSEEFAAQVTEIAS